MRRLGIALLALAVSAWVPLSGGDRTSPEDRDWGWSGRVDRGDGVEIKGVNGEVHAELARGNEVEVEARLHGRRDDPDEIEMVVLEHEDGVTICAVYPSDDPDEPNECRPGGRGRMNVRNNDVEVDFVVRVPSGVNFVGRTVNGDVDALGLEGDIEAHTVNGGVDISTTGLAHAATVNGSITVSMGRADWQGTMDFTTVNGSVTLEFPGDLDCEVSISTVNGHISSDYPLTVHGRFSPRHLKGTIGGGGRDLVVKTVNGSVQIRRS
ncbi:MAG: DUF4097 family beta strand repeat protein [Gemmatimonadota bacterium]|nr:MAG: DUF4097 family beta strand repeat protein [Gemmatimonadota bacterium]